MTEAKRQTLFPLVLTPKEMTELRESIPTQQRSATIRNLLRQAGLIGFTDQSAEHQKTSKA
ncbi:hypothetical protein H6F89_29550 [Cyanobacteria bacterium FACHB-63]|nr:hypothetical protein [Cyanobacteria bacterium FACHB-63]